MDTSGNLWSKLKTQNPIIVLELKAAKFTIMTFSKVFNNEKIVHLQMDNVVVLSYLEKIGGTQGNMRLTISIKDHGCYRIHPRGLLIKKQISRSAQYCIQENANRIQQFSRNFANQSGHQTSTCLL